MTSEYTFFDTTLQIHRLDLDPKLRDAAESEFASCRPIAMSVFSLVEFKSAYVQKLVLLQKKTQDSDSFGGLCGRIKKVTDRACRMMFMLLMEAIDEFGFNPKQWDETRRQILTHLDTQIEGSWLEIKQSVDLWADDFKCSRALEEPEENIGMWSATIPKCIKKNTSCEIVSFMNKHGEALQRLVTRLSDLDTEQQTRELRKIKEVAQKTISSGQFPWEGTICRSVGDLLIGLQSKAGKEFVSSNKKEHGPMHGPLGYNFREFDMVQFRS